jgi:5-hydroxyisourate hydrolase
MASDMKGISTHILDTVRGKPAADVPVRLEKQNTSGAWQLVTSARTDRDGRCSQLLPAEENLPGIYRLTFDTGNYFLQQQMGTLYPQIEITFRAQENESHFHIPLLVSPNGYTTYRGS